ncbi:metal-sensing transcriptional repressor [Patescibacteria group bacterium]|nr:metal-sensing transcriptional repressor [Patescibacteria group bacterium]
MKKTTKAKVLRRLKILEGQVRGIHKMIEKDIYCVDILHQTLALKEGLSGVENSILENHLDTHVVQQIKKGKSAKATREILSIYKLSRKI